MPIDPVLLAVLEAFPMQFDDLGSMTAQEVRALFEQGNPPPGEDVASVEDLEVPGPDGPLPVRVYRPDGAAVPAPVVVFFHGGGWVLGSIATHDATCRGLANRTGAVYVSVDYRLAPEHPYPAAPEDCYAATCWVVDHAADLEALDLDDVSPMANPFPLVNVLRADEPGHDDIRAEILAAAPSVEDGQFRVPPVLGEAP